MKLAPGTLLKLLDGMNMRDQRRSLLQVIDIHPANLNENSLLPTNGFYIKLSDSTHSMYVSLPIDQDDLVLNNTIQLGQFLHVDRLDSGSPVPIIKGAKPLGGRQPLIGFPEPITQVVVGNRRTSWGSNQNLTQSTSSCRRPEKEKSSWVACRRAYVNNQTLLSGKSMNAGTKGCSSAPNKPHQLHSTISPKNSSINLGMPLHGKLDALEKEATQQRESAQKVALTATRVASTAETLIQSLKIFSELSVSTRPDDPAVCFDQFLSFHQEITQAVIDLETIQAAATSKIKMNKSNEDGMPILHDSEQEKSKRRTLKSCDTESRILKSNFDTDPRRNGNKIPHSYGEAPYDGINGESGAALIFSLSSSIRLAKKIQTECGHWFMDFLEAALVVGLKITRGSAGRDEKRGWCTESLILEVVNWVEADQQGDSWNRSVHHKSAEVARKLRREVRNHYFGFN